MNCRLLFILCFVLGSSTAASAALSEENLTALGRKLGKRVAKCVARQNLPVVLKTPKNGTDEAIDESAFTEALRESLEKTNVRFMSEASAETDTYLTLNSSLEARKSDRAGSHRVLYQAKGELVGSRDQKIACASAVTLKNRERR